MRFAGLCAWLDDDHVIFLQSRESRKKHCLGGDVPGLQRLKSQRSTLSDISCAELRFSRPRRTSSVVQRATADSSHSAGPLRSTDLIMPSTRSVTSANCTRPDSKKQVIRWHAALQILDEVMCRAVSRHILSQRAIKFDDWAVLWPAALKSINIRPSKVSGVVLTKSW